MTKHHHVFLAHARAARVLRVLGRLSLPICVLYACAEDGAATGAQPFRSSVEHDAAEACEIREAELSLAPGASCSLNASDAEVYRLSPGATVTCGADGRAAVSGLVANGTIRLNGLQISCGASATDTRASNGGSDGSAGARARAAGSGDDTEAGAGGSAASDAATSRGSNGATGSQRTAGAGGKSPEADQPTARGPVGGASGMKPVASGPAGGASGESAARTAAPSGDVCAISEGRLRLARGTSCVLSEADKATYHLLGGDTVTCAADGSISFSGLSAGGGLRLNGLSIACDG